MSDNVCMATAAALQSLLTTVDAPPLHLDRRRGLRVAQRRPIKLLEPMTGRYLPGMTLDLSRTGLRLRLGTRLPLLTGHVVKVHIGLSPGQQPLANRRNMLPARVVWTVQSAGQTELGLELVADSNATHAA
jgi:hypothetical protein